MKVKVLYTFTCEISVPDGLMDQSSEKTHDNVVKYLEDADSWPEIDSATKRTEQVIVYRKITPSYQVKPVRGFVS